MEGRFSGSEKGERGQALDLQDLGVGITLQGGASVGVGEGGEEGEALEEEGVCPGVPQCPQRRGEADLQRGERRWVVVDPQKGAFPPDSDVSGVRVAPEGDREVRQEVLLGLLGVREGENGRSPGGHDRDGPRGRLDGPEVPVGDSVVQKESPLAPPEGDLLLDSRRIRGNREEDALFLPGP